MEGVTHRTFGVIAMGAMLVSAGVPPGWQAAVSLAVSALAAYGPDLDTARSTISGAVPGAGIVGRLVAHRTVTHSLLMTGVIWILLTHLAVPWYVLAGVVIGWISHWFIDMFNREGVQLFWPLPIWVKFLPKELGIETGGYAEKWLRRALMLVEVVFLWAYFALLVLPHLQVLPFAWGVEVWVKHNLGYLAWHLLRTALHAVLRMP